MIQSSELQISPNPQPNQLDNLIDIYLKSPSIPLNISKLKDGTDEEFVQVLNEYVKAETHTPASSLTFKVKLPAVIKQHFVTYVIERIAEKIANSNDEIILEKLLKFIQPFDHVVIPSKQLAFREYNMAVALKKKSIYLFEKFLRYVKASHQNTVNQNEIVKVLLLGKSIKTEPQSLEKLKAYFYDLETEQDQQFFSLVCTIQLLKFKRNKVNLTSEEIEQVSNQFKIEKNPRNQKILEICVLQDIDSFNSLIKQIVKCKFIIKDSKPKYQINQQLFHPSLLTEQNIKLFEKHVIQRQTGDQAKLYLKDTIIQTEDGIYIKFPIDCYSPKSCLKYLNIIEHMTDAWNYIKLINKSIMQKKPLYTPFQTVSLEDKIKLLSFVFYLFCFICEEESEEEPYEHMIMYDNETYQSTFKLIEHVLQQEESVHCIKEIKDLLKKIFYSCLMITVDAENCAKFLATGVVEIIYNILNKYPQSRELTSEVMVLYERGFKEILKMNKNSKELKDFESELFFENLLHSYTKNKFSEKRKNIKVIELLVMEYPAYQNILKDFIASLTQELVKQPDEYFNSYETAAEANEKIQKLQELLTLRNYVPNKGIEEYLLKFQQLRSHLSSFNLSQHTFTSQPSFYQDVVLSEQKFKENLTFALTTIKGGELKQQLLNPKLSVPSPTLVNFLTAVTFVHNYIKYQQKHTYKIYSQLYKQIFQLNLELSNLSFTSTRSLKQDIYTFCLNSNELSTYQHNLNVFLLSRENTFLQQFDEIRVSFNQLLFEMLKPYNKKPHDTPAKVPLHNFVKLYKEILESLKQEKDKERIIFLIQVLASCLGNKKNVLPVQSFFYIFVELQEDILAIANKLFSMAQNREFLKITDIPVKAFNTKTHIQKCKLKQIEKEAKEEIQQFHFRMSISKLLNICFQRQVLTNPWIVQNIPDEPKYTSTQKLALYILLKQFSILIKNLNKQNLIIHQQYLKQFLTPNFQKTNIIDTEATPASKKNGNNLRAQRQIMQVLVTMGYSAGIVEMVVSELEEPTLESALEWLNQKHGELDIYEAEWKLRKQPSSKKKLQPLKTQAKFGMKEIQLEAFKVEFTNQLKVLFSQYLLPGLYGEHKKRIPVLIMLCIERFDKEESRIKNYRNFLNYLMKELNAELQKLKQDKKQPELNEERLNVQLSNLQKVIRFAIKKSIKDQAIESDLISNMITLLTYYLNKPQLSQSHKSNLNFLISIFQQLIPKKPTQNISLQLNLIVDKLLLLKSKFNLTSSKKFWSIISSQINTKVLFERAKVIIETLFDDVNSDRLGFIPEDIIFSLLNSNQEFVLANIEAEIKSYFYCEGESKLVSKNKRDFVTHFEKQSKNEVFYKMIKKLLKKKTEKIGNNKKVVYMIYFKEKNSYTNSTILNKPFIEYTPTEIQQQIINKIHESFNIVSKSRKHNQMKIDLLHKLIDKYPLLHNSLFFHQLEGRSLLEEILVKTSQHKDLLSNIYTFFGTKTGVLVTQKSRILHYSHYLQYQIINLLLQQSIITQSKGNLHPILLSLCYLLQFTNFNNLSIVPLSPIVPSLRQTLESNFDFTNHILTLILSEPLTLIYKQLTFASITDLYLLHDQDTFSNFQSQLIYLPLIYAPPVEESLAQRQLRYLGREFALEINDVRDAHTLLNRLERSEGNITRLIELFRRGDSFVEQVGLDYLPVQPRGERKESKVSNAGEVYKEKYKEKEKSVEEVKQVKQEDKVRYLSQEFDTIPVQIVSSEVREQKQPINETKADFTKFKVPETPPTTTKPSPVQTFDLPSYSCKYNDPLIARINTLWKQIDQDQQRNNIKIKNIVIEENETAEDKQDRELEAIIFNLRKPVQTGPNNEIIEFGESTFERMARYERPSRGLFEINNRRSQRESQQERELVETQIENLLEEYVEEKPKEEIKVVKEVEKKQEKKQEQPKVEQKVEEKVQEKVQIKTEEKVEEKVEENKEQQKKEEKIEQKVEDKNPTEVVVEKKQQQQTQEPQQPIHQSEQPREAQKIQQIPNAPKVQQKKQQTVQTKPQQKQQKQQQKVQQTQQQAPPVNQQKVEQPQQQSIAPVLAPAPPAPRRYTNPPRYRQLLQLIGVSQHFLRNNNLDEQQFDSWSEQIQTQTLFQLISFQNTSNVPEQSKNQQGNITHEGQNENNNIPVEIQDDNVFGMYTETALLLASIDDPEMREQIFLQASPEVIMTLPIELQEEAEVVRQRRIREIAAEEEEEYMNNNNPNQRRKARRNKENLVYPPVPKQLFKIAVDEKILFKIIQSLYFKKQSATTLLIQSCIQNKQNQEKMINTLLYILRNPLTCQQFPKEVVELANNNKEPVAEGKTYVRNTIFNILARIIKSCPYKDKQFLKQKFSYQGLLSITLSPNKDLFIDNIVTEQYHYPYIELLSHSLESNNFSLSSYLLQNYSSEYIPPTIIQKIINTFKQDTLPSDFIKNLKYIENNEQLRETFNLKFPKDNHPKISIFANLLKYKFAKVDYLKELHLKLLKNYKPEYNRFLNEIYRHYTIEEIKGIKEELEKYITIHKEVIKELLTLSSNVFLEPISIILKLPFLIDFETKRDIFSQKIQSWNEEGGYVGRLELRIDRINLFSGSFSQIAPRTKQEMRGKLNITFEDEGAYDAGGLTREWFLIISKQMFNPNYALFQQSSSGNTYHPSSKSYINPDHLRYFKFIGRIVGKALMEKCLIDAYFTRSFYKLILGQDLTLNDMESSDFNFYTSMMWIKNNEIEDDFYRFAYDIQNFGKIETIELVENGKNIQVTEKNKHEFVQKICEVKMKTQTHEQIKAFLEGFHQLIPLQSIQYFTAQELQLLMSGLPSIDFKDLKQNTDYQGYTKTDKQIVWFWQILQTFDQEQLAKIVQFITGTSKIPTDGFKGLKGMHGNQKISIHKHFSTNQLPQSHTCFNQLDLPEYATKEVMEKMLRTALKWGSESFGFM